MQPHDIATIALQSVKELAAKEADTTDFAGSYGDGYRAAMRLVLASIQGAENAITSARTDLKRKP